MATKVRNEMQKARRKYLEKCKKEGANPIPALLFAKAWNRRHKADKPAEEPKKAADKKPVVKSKAVVRHMVHRGDTIVLADFCAVDIVDLIGQMKELVLEKVKQTEKEIAKSKKKIAK